MSIKSPLNRQFGTQFDSVFDVVKSNPMYDKSGGKIPSLDLNFAKSKSLSDSRSTKNLINFTRASTGTYVGSDGLIKTSPVNLFTYSKDFSLGWTPLQVTLSTNHGIAPDGTNTAALVTINTAASYNMILQTPTLSANTDYCYSVFVKLVSGSGTSTRFVFGASNSLIDPVYASYGLQLDTLSETRDGNEPSVKGYVEYPDGWYRIYMSVNTSSQTNPQVQLRFGTAGADDIAEFLIWGAQLQEGTTATTYVPTTNLQSGAPRFDHDPVTGESLGLLIEESRTNGVRYSEQFNNSWWVTGYTNVTPNTDTAPTGTITASTFSSSGTHLSTNFIPITSNTVYTCSLYIKKTTGRSYTCGLLLNYDAGTLYGILLNTNDGTTTTSAYTVPTVIVDSVDDYWRIALTANSGSTTNVRVLMYPNLSASTAAAAGEQVIWGAQLEAGSFPTSYIPTSGQVGGVTRSPDIATIEGNKFAKTNLIEYSERFDNAYWTENSGTAVTPNSTAAPDGTATADTVKFAQQYGNIRKFDVVTTSGAEATVSFYAKNIDGNTNLYLRGSSSGGIYAKPITVTNEWARYSATFTHDGTNNIGFVLQDTNASGFGSVAIWGAQLEEGDELTKYTPSVESFVSRASTATYVDDTTGLIKTTPVNLLTYSEDFNSGAWYKGNSTITTNTVVSPAGTLTADTLSINSGATYGRIQKTNLNLASGVYTLSYYVKNTVDIGSNIIQVLDSSNTSETIVLTSFSGTTTPDWTRYEHTFDIDSSALTNLNQLRIDFRPSPSPSTGSSTIDIWGVQLEEGSTATPYIKTGSAKSGAARYENGELLLEEARTNLVTYSEELNNAAWGQVSTGVPVVTPNILTAPDGTITGDLVVGNNVNTWIANNVGAVGAGQYSFSVWLKSDIAQTADIFMSYGVTDNLVCSVTTNWQRFTLTATRTATAGLFVGVNVGNAKNIYIWGTQLEAAPYASSYIPTDGTPGGITRAADVSTSALGVDSWYNQSEGTVYSEFAWNLNNQSNYTFPWYIRYDGDNGNGVYLGNWGSTTRQSLGVRFNSPGVTSQLPIPGSTPGVSHKYATTLNAFDFAVALDGGFTGTYTGADLATSMNSIHIGNVGGSYQINGHISRLAYFPTRLPDDKLKSITT